MSPFLRITSLTFLIGILMSTGISAQEIRSRLISFNTSLSNSLVFPAKEIIIDNYLNQGYAFWHSNAQVEVYLVDFEDSLFSQTTTDSLGYFHAKIPQNRDCYIKIEGAEWQYGENHIPLYIKSIKQNHTTTIPFIPYLRSSSSLGEYVYVKQKRKFPFQKEKWKHVHNPPTMYDPYSLGMYIFRYNDYECSLLKKHEDCEIYFPTQYHALVDLRVKKIKFRRDSLYHLEDSLYRNTVLAPDEEAVKPFFINLVEESFYERFPGGKASFERFIEIKRKLPQEVPKTSCYVKVSCILKADGSLIYPVITKSYDSWHDQEAIRLIKLLPKPKPLRSRARIRTHLIHIDIEFKYPK
ncbi:hypothetical protein [Flavivirga jejuensis]|uniref:TonB-like protein n=1 Tax=Flavivirga jejuensis TaxID=870487 RepID=A0ABT8WUL7_9FLAO|nr:hypothetical protein [Flavivirga jejuensis]MDO5976784.1 hypothetical protein [Flavivirga jejuensis]